MVQIISHLVTFFLIKLVAMETVLENFPQGGNMKYIDFQELQNLGCDFVE